MLVFALGRNEQRLNALAKNNGKIVPFRVNIRVPEQIRRVFEEIEKDYGPVDALINNAAIFQMKEFI